MSGSLTVATRLEDPAGSVAFSAYYLRNESCSCPMRGLGGLGDVLWGSGRQVYTVFFKIAGGVVEMGVNLNIFTYIYIYIYILFTQNHKNRKSL